METFIDCEYLIHVPFPNYNEDVMHIDIQNNKVSINIIIHHE